MSRPDRSWTIAPALLWFAGALVVALCLVDGGVGALADRFRARREPAPPAAPGPAFPPAPTEVAEAPGTPAVIAPGVRGEPIAPVADRGKVLALEDTCVDGPAGRCKRWAMDGFYRALRDARGGALGRALRVSWYGDSVIATDALPARLRARLQAELGDGGPGFVYLSPPHRFCGHEAITRVTSGSWTTHAISTLQVADGMYGVGGSTAETEDGRSLIKLVAGTVSRLELYYLAQPHGGSATIAADGKPIATVDTRGDARQPGYAAVRVDTGARSVDVTARGRIRVFGISLENPTGAVVDNLGVVSVHFKSFDALDPDHFQAELAHRAADLVMIMIGANEAQWLLPGDRDTRDYAEHYGKLLAQIRKARPEASCLVVSPTDQAELKDGGYVSRAVIPRLVQAQRAAARAQGCGFYSTYDWMGGAGSAARWFRRGLVGADFLHLSHAGSDRIAEGLFGTLMAGYQAYASH